MEAIKHKHWEPDYGPAPAATQKRPQTSAELTDRRRNARLRRRFSVKFCKMGLYFPVEGVTENIGPFGAFIKLNDLHSFQLHDQIILTLSIPPSFSGQETTIGLQGSAQIVRLVEDNEGVAVKFAGPLK